MDRTASNLFYRTYGRSGNPALVFLHGYLESSEIWEEFSGFFSGEYHVINIDIPGHGKSESLSENTTMDEIADAIISLTDSLGIGKFNLVGHSMGGYLAMAILEKYPLKLNSLTLFHSTCYPDSDEKKTNRDREAELVRQGKKDLIVNTNIPRLYASDNLESMKEYIGRSKSIALQTPDNGIISVLHAMKSRPDRSHVLVATKVPVLLIGGMKENLIPPAIMENMKSLSGRIKLVFLENSGHMGFFEEKEKAARELGNFLNDNYECL